MCPSNGLQINSRDCLLLDSFRLGPRAVQDLQELRRFGPHARVNVRLEHTAAENLNTTYTLHYILYSTCSKIT